MAGYESQTRSPQQFSFWPLQRPKNRLKPELQTRFSSILAFGVQPLGCLPAKMRIAAFAEGEIAPTGSFLADSAQMDASATIADLGEADDLARVAATDHLDPQKRFEFGQGLTPYFVAKLMAERLSLRRSSTRLLDPGAGIGSLTAAVVDRILQSNQRPTSFHMDAFDIDSMLADHLEETLELCARHLARVGVYFTHVIHRSDFISDAS